MVRPILNIADIEYQPWGRGEKFAAQLGEIATRIGAQKLGYNLTVIPAGKRAFPMHSHMANEEMFFVLDGAGELRIGQERFTIRSGDVIACPPGPPHTAHQIINTSARELRFLAVSTRLSPEICHYPDSGKMGVLAELPAAADGTAQRLRIMARKQSTPEDYWDGE